MMVLGFDTSSVTATVALVSEDKLLADYTLNNKKNHSEKLMPLISQMLNDLEIEPAEIDAVAVAEGPGSFTGLRIGAATAKGLSYAAGIPVIGVNTLEALAYNLNFSPYMICPVLNARRGQVYTGLYMWENNELKTIFQCSAVEIEKILKVIKNLDQPVFFLGDGTSVFKEQIISVLGGNAIWAPPPLSIPRASSVAFLGLNKLLKGEKQTPFEFKPQYFRRSQAEIQFEKRCLKEENQ
ncbi:MAG: tRNA threonylcarbamoyladenosine biosynthesis protein TsaB [Thermosediminibacterales bacterium]|nr:tRNA threonylcarbamoyladenosine biosynthesis protein TsaB [Thermosediminibacterales bacterium]MDK2835663.1 tRNA threonylcarbamoyladenosine biosynthesis protein TsaB [Thermosediminibacterales bacterium]